VLETGTGRVFEGIEGGSRCGEGKGRADKRRGHYWEIVEAMLLTAEREKRSER
jgi:hypothetical protein